MPRGNTVEIPLTLGKVAIIDAADYEIVSRYKWHAERTSRGCYYAATTIGRRTVRMHQVVMPDAVERDHKDGDGLNNRRSNLRSVTHAQNMHNAKKPRKPNTTSRFKGVTFQPRLIRRPWQARMGSTHLGYFPTEEEAAAAYDSAALKERGIFALVNCVDATPSANHRYSIVRKEFIANPTPGHPEGRVVEYELSCGHVFKISAYKATKLGSQSRCKICAEAIK